ncbi:DUF5343 domain-containing protein [Flavobacterium agricola]|uniref:DUF5343 domain-containing protein n=1 Tax=Flavobacterium agricola TaxID=2870839 RepID=A0ABY6M0W2_9FLAO|nr:DUF5343 domain-containing protein [Flavobacterium agricola]UYW01892.1 DUF5343 domain-containing protein [Flavobacterium agricola]
MIAVITGDIIGSRKVDAGVWLPQLKTFFTAHLPDASRWEIYRGDSFQLQTSVFEALSLALCIKALIKTHALLDVRMAIGIGLAGFVGERITESGGTAFVNSGDGFELLKNNTLQLKSPFETFDSYFNPMLKLVGFIADQWKPATAEALFYRLRYPDLLQKDLAGLLGKDKSTLNKALKRGVR